MTFHPGERVYIRPGADAHPTEGLGPCSWWKAYKKAIVVRQTSAGVIVIVGNERYIVFSGDLTKNKGE
jgi:hypothetical protein